jgi:hypothetical protein
MRVREITSDELEAWRAKGAQKVQDLLNTSKTQDEKFADLKKLFDGAVYAIDHCGEHFVGNEFQPTNDEHVQRSEEEIRSLMLTRVKAEQVMTDVVYAMKDMSLSHVNGTSLIFRECAEKAGVNITDHDFVMVDIHSNIALPETMIAAYK